MNETAQPTVSVVVPCHNAAPFLRETLTSILSQSFGDLEVLLVDDGSDDDPEPIVRGMDDGRVRYMRTPASGGPSRPRNLGIAAARGRYVFFFDADDIMLPGKIAAQVERFESGPELGLLFTNFQVVDAAGAVTNRDFLADYATFHEVRRQPSAIVGGLDRAALHRCLLRANFIGTSGVAVRRTVLQQVGGFDEDLASSEDIDLWLRIARGHDCGYVDVIGHSYRRHAASVMHQFEDRHPLSRIRVLRRHLPDVCDPVTRRAVGKRLADNYVAIGYVWQVKGDMTRAARNYFEAFRIGRSPAALGWAAKCLLRAPRLRRGRMTGPATGGDERADES